ncbi:MAG: F0F1 ATP synthase subunit epsilon [Bifidobacteriaceae bacterium]|jgi:F-type H+-transporting ATPase subunit epsilon|nr:F0F1 ATP synthase subunit epsilon [Bifidobacteriaceae bacterium]
MAERSLRVDVVDRTAPVWSGPATFVTVPTPEGSIGVYPRHQPLLSVLGEGEVRIQSGDDAWLIVQVSGGFVSVDSDVVTVVTDTATLEPNTT